MGRTGELMRRIHDIGTRPSRKHNFTNLFRHPHTKTVMLVSANDYKGSGHELSCTQDAQHVQVLAKNCGIEVHTLFDRQCTREGVAGAIQNIASQCGPEDTFIWYFSGHGTQVTDVDGDEVDNQDEAYVMVTEDGSIFEPDGNPCVLTDDEFVSVITSSLHPEATFISISDCCHSGSICDLHKPVWNGRKAISISGCRDAQTSGDIGSGGICTWAMLLSVEALQETRAQYSMARLFHEVLRQDDRVFNSKQDITMDHSKGCSPHDVPFPLIPKGKYTTPQLPSPYKKIGGMAEKVVISGMASANPSPYQAQPQAAYPAPQYQAQAQTYAQAPQYKPQPAQQYQPSAMQTASYPQVQSYAPSQAYTQPPQPAASPYHQAPATFQSPYGAQQAAVQSSPYAAFKSPYGVNPSPYGAQTAGFPGYPSPYAAVQ